MRKNKISGLLAFALFLFSGLSGAQDKPADSGLLTLERICGSREFAAERFGPARWMRDGESYTTVERNADVPGGRDLVLYRAETGRREVLVSAGRLVPLGASSPVSIEDGYKNGSPITFTKNLKGNLLIVHGTGDDNVHYQSFEMLVNELIANGQQFTMMSYPNQSHGISEGRGTTMHLYNLLTSYLKTHLTPGGR